MGDKNMSDFYLFFFLHFPLIYFIIEKYISTKKKKGKLDDIFRNLISN